MTAAGSEEIAVRAMKLGAADYVVKHGRWVDTLPDVVREAIGARVVTAALAPEPAPASPGIAPGIRAVLCAEPHTWITRAMLRFGAPDHHPAIPPARSLREIVRDVELATISTRRSRSTFGSGRRGTSATGG